MKRWTWNKGKRVYESGSETLSKRALAKGIDEYIESVKEGMAEKVAEFSAGRMTASALFNFLEDEVTALHGASGSIAYGGLEQMDEEKFARIDARLRSELSYLDNFKADVQAAADSGELSAEGIAGRAGLYAEAAYGELLNQTVERERDNGVNKGRRVLIVEGGDDASCDACIEAATEEFIPLEDIPEIGSLTCLSNCRCEIEFSVEGQEFRTSEIFQGVVGGQPQYGGDVTIQ